MKNAMILCLKPIRDKYLTISKLYVLTFPKIRLLNFKTVFVFFKYISTLRCTDAKGTVLR